MLTPEEMQKKIFALGRKLDNNDVGMFVKELQINYQFLFNEVEEQKKQIKGMEAKLQHYRNIESSLQDAMVSAEKVSESKIREAEVQAREIEKRAYKKADEIICDAQKELTDIQDNIIEFKNSYKVYQDKYLDFVQGQIKFIDDAKKLMDEEKLDVAVQPEVDGHFFDKSDLDDVQGEIASESEENDEFADYDLVSSYKNILSSEDNKISIDSYVTEDSSVENNDVEDIAVDVEETVPPTEVYDNLATDDIVEETEDLVDYNDAQKLDTIIDEPMTVEIHDDLDETLDEEREEEVNTKLEEPVPEPEVVKNSIFKSFIKSAKTAIKEDEYRLNADTSKSVNNKDIALDTSQKAVEEKPIDLRAIIPEKLMAESEEKSTVIPEPMMEEVVESVSIPEPIMEEKIEPVPMPQPIIEEKIEPVPMPEPIKEEKVEPVSVPEPIKEEKIEPVPMPELEMDEKSEDLSKELDIDIPDMVLSNEEIENFDLSGNIPSGQDLNNNMIDDSIEVDFHQKYGSELEKEGSFDLPELDVDDMGFDDISVLDDMDDLPDINDNIMPTGPDLSINSNIDLSNVENSPFVHSKKKVDKNAEILKSMNLSSSESEKKESIRKYEKMFAEDLLSNNLKMMQESMKAEQEASKNNEENVNERMIDIRSNLASMDSSPYMANTNAKTLDEDLYDLNGKNNII